jgi:hypothetical protein
MYTRGTLSGFYVQILPEARASLAAHTASFLSGQAIRMRFGLAKRLL